VQRRENGRKQKRGKGWKEMGGNSLKYISCYGLVIISKTKILNAIHFDALPNLGLGGVPIKMIASPNRNSKYDTDAHTMFTEMQCHSSGT